MECLDSDALIAILRNSAGARELAEMLDRRGNAATTSISVFEVLFGAKKSGRIENVREAERLLDKLRILPFDDQAADRASTIHSELVKKGQQVDLRDMFIGSIAITHRASLVTRNVKHFSKIPELTTIKW